MERGSQAIRLDCYRRVDHGEALKMSPDTGTDRPWLHSASKKKEQESIVQLIPGHYTSIWWIEGVGLEAFLVGASDNTVA